MIQSFSFVKCKSWLCFVQKLSGVAGFIHSRFPLPVWRPCRLFRFLCWICPNQVPIARFPKFPNFRKWIEVDRFHFCHVQSVPVFIIWKISKDFPPHEPIQLLSRLNLWFHSFFWLFDISRFLWSEFVCIQDVQEKAVTKKLIPFDHSFVVRKKGAPFSGWRSKASAHSTVPGANC